MLVNYDELNKDIEENNAFYRFKEPTMVPTFFPTYKKKEDRPVLDINDLHNWLTKTYRIKYKVPWYKSIKHESV